MRGLLAYGDAKPVALAPSRVGRSHLRCLGQQFGETALQLVESYQEPDCRAVVV